MGGRRRCLILARVPLDWVSSRVHPPPAGLEDQGKCFFVLHRRRPMAAFEMPSTMHLTCVISAGLIFDARHMVTVDGIITRQRNPRRYQPTGTSLGWGCSDFSQLDGSSHVGCVRGGKNVLVTSPRTWRKIRPLDLTRLPRGRLSEQFINRIRRRPLHAMPRSECANPPIVLKGRCQTLNSDHTETR